MTDLRFLSLGSVGAFLGKATFTGFCVAAIFASFYFATVLVPTLPGGSSSAENGFVHWLQLEGTKLDGISLRHFGEELGRGVLATKEIARGALMLTLPPQVLIERSQIIKNSNTHDDIIRPIINAKAETARRQAYAQLANKGDEVLLGAYLIEQMYLGKRSKWNAYMDVLPEGVPVAVNWDEAQLMELQDAQQELSCRHVRDSTVSTFRTIRSTIFRVLKASQTLTGRKDDDHELIPFCELEYYLRVQSLISSRALSFEGRRVLAPLADMFNYRSASDMRPNQSGAAFLKYHQWDRTGDGSLRIISERATASGEQVFEDYGDNPNHVYLQYHGFVPDHNPFDCIVLDLPSIDIIIEIARGAQGEVWMGPFSWLHTQAGMSAVALERRTKALGPAPRMCMGSAPDMERKDIYFGVRYLLASMVDPRICNDEVEKDLQKLQECLRKHIGDSARPGIAWLRAFARRRLRQYSTTYSQDAALLQSASTPEFRVAIRFRMAQKRLLHEFLQLDLHFVDVRDERADRASLLATSLVGAIKEIDGAQPLHSRIDVGCQDLDLAIKTFNDWMDEQGAPVYHVRAVRDDKYRVGVAAVKRLSTDEAYLAVPDHVIMSVESAMRDGSDARDLIVAMRQRFARGDPFHELLLHLIYERFVERENSFFWPYLQLLPQPGEQSSSLSFSQRIVAALQPSTAWIDIERYQKRVKDTYDMVSAIPEIGEFLSDEIFTFEHYKWAHAILDSRSIWWNGERHLVPLLDLVNCHGGPNKTRVHETRWELASRSAITHADRPYQAGDQVFENYGQPNKIYMIYHGFMLEHNPHDYLEIDLYLAFQKSSPAVYHVLRRSNLREGYNRFAIGGSLSRSHDENYSPLDDRMKAFLDLKYGQMSAASRLYASALHEVLPLSKIYCGQTGDPEHPSLSKFTKLIEDEGIVLGDWDAVVAAKEDIKSDETLQEVRKFLRAEYNVLLAWMEEVADLYWAEKQHKESEELDTHDDERNLHDADASF